MVLKVRTHPTTVFYLSGEDARLARDAAGDEAGDAPCFTTESFGNDGFVWDTPEAFEESYADAFGGLCRTPARPAPIRD